KHIHEYKNTQSPNSFYKRGHVVQNDGNVVYVRIHTFSRRALEGGAVFHRRDRRLAVWARENFEQLGVDRHAREYMTPFRFCGTIPGMKLAVLAAVLSMSIPLAAEQAGGSRQPAGAPTPPDKIAEAYNQSLLGHR